MTASPAPSSIAERVLPRAKGARFQGLDGLRAIAALLILLHHVGFQSAATFTSPMGGYLARMDIGVPIFFTLSGFLLFRPIVVSVVDDTPLRPALDHLWRRAMRIYPAFWVSLLLIVVLTSEEFRDTGAAFTTLALVHIHWPDHVIGPMPQSWSLATEVTFYASLPLLARLIRPVLRDRAPAHRMTGLLFVVAGLYLASLFFRLLMFGLANDWTPAAVLWLPATIDYFAIGMGLAVLHAGAPSGSPLRERLERLAGPARWWWLAAAVVFVFVAQGLGLARGLAVATWPREMLRQLLYGVIGLCLLFPLVFGGDEGGVRRFVRRPTWHWLGTISYSIYLWHMVFIVHPWGPMDRAVDRIWNNTIRTDWFDRYQWTRLESLLDSRFVVVGVVAAVPTLVVAAASFYLVERAGLAVQGRVRRPVIDPTPSESLVARAVSRWRDASFRAQLAVIGGGGVAGAIGICRARQTGRDARSGRGLSGRPVLLRAGR